MEGGAVEIEFALHVQGRVGINKQTIHACQIDPCKCSTAAPTDGFPLCVWPVCTLETFIKHNEDSPF